ncbi:MAG: hypothetical protein ACRYHA_20820 [Janthinobacterium lividum]
MPSSRLVSFYCALALSAFSTSASADVCPKPDEKISTSPYTSVTRCPAVRVEVAGDLNPEKYQSCLNLVPAAREHVSFAGQDGKAHPLPTVAMLLRDAHAHEADPQSMRDREKYEDAQRMTWMASPVQCIGEDRVSITYSNGGNCTGCERFAIYRFSRDGVLLDSRLRPYPGEHQQ